MKKRLLITSIVMMLVVAVALSTATYAWFTSNATVTANNINITAGTSNAPSLSIKWTTGGTFGTSLTGITAPDTLMPVAPATLVKTGESISVASQTYYNSTIKAVGGNPAFNGGTELKTWSEASQSTNYATPYYLNNTTSNTITLKNESSVTTLYSVKVKADITGSAAKLVRIAFYKNDGSAYKLVDVLGYSYAYTSAAETTYSNTQTYYKKDAHDHYIVETVADATDFGTKKATLYTRDAATTAATATYGEITENKLVSAMSSYTCSNEIDLGSLTPTTTAATNTMELKVVIWLDGLALNDETQGFDGIINLSFTADSTPVEP